MLRVTGVEPLRRGTNVGRKAIYVTAINEPKLKPYNDAPFLIGLTEWVLLWSVDGLMGLDLPVQRMAEPITE